MLGYPYEPIKVLRMKNELDDLIRRLHAGSANREEMARLLQLLDHGKEPSLETITELWEVDKPATHGEPDLQAIKERLREKMYPEVKMTKGKSAYIRDFAYKWMIRGAAAVLLMLSGYALWEVLSADHITEIASSDRRTIVLPDGSTAILNRGTTLKYNEDWTQAEYREVWLGGEAFFKVNPSSQKFRVATPDVDIEVLGTSFNVNCKDAKTSIFLEEGRVKLYSKYLDNEFAELQPGDLAVFTADTRTIAIRQKVSPDLHTSWKDGIIKFDESPMIEVIEKIEDNYQVEIKVAESNLYTRTISTGVPADSLSLAIEILEKTMGLTIDQVDNHLTIYPKN